MTAAGTTPCGTCGACCRSYVVPLLGEDVWRLSTRQRLAPEEFVLAHPQAEPASDGFLLASDGPPLGLALDKQGRFRDTQPCVFLLELGGGHSRCGVYADRPLVCQGYPMSVLAGRVRQRDDALCPANAWPVEEAALERWRRPLRRLRMAWDLYAEVTARWNARVTAAGPGRSFELGEYFAYLLNLYDQLDRLNRLVGDAAVAAAVDDWPMPPRPGASAPDPERAWWRYFSRARERIDGFYRQIGPLAYTLASDGARGQAPAIGSRGG
jgi:Fe-S-cluster containining protein